MTPAQLNTRVKKQQIALIDQESSFSQMEQWIPNCEAFDDIFEPIPLDTSLYGSSSDQLQATLNETLQILFAGEQSIGESEEVGVNCDLSWGAMETEIQPDTPVSSDRLNGEDQQRFPLVDSQYKSRRFRPYQAYKWENKFQELVIFHKDRGHCSVPHTFPSNPSLGRWVKRQRYQYKLMLEGKESTMTRRRAQKLENAGFVWDAHSLAWEERFSDLKDYLQQYGDCNVPTIYNPNRQLATWVKCQRRQYKLFHRDAASTITPGRVHKLNSIGFTWELRSARKRAN